MSKASSRGRGYTGPNGLVDQVDRSPKKKAQQTWVLVGLVVGVLAVLILSEYMHPILAVFAGILLGVVLGAVCALVVYIWPVLRKIWWWLPETLLAAGLLVGWNELAHHTTLPVRALIVAVVVGVPAVIPWLRHRVLDVYWCFAARHRVRVCFTSFIITNRYDTDPFILWARPTMAGTRVWVWLRPGISVEDLKPHAARIASTCWVDQAMVERASQTNSAYIYIDLKRRNAFADPVDSPLLDELDPTTAPAELTAPIELPTALNLTDVTDDDVTPEEPTEDAKPSSRKPGPKPRPGLASAGGDDIDAWL